MSSDFKSMMANRSVMKEKAKEFATAGGFKKDLRFWEPTPGKDGNASATFRFLPQQDFNKEPKVTRMRHAFKKGGKQFFGYCPKSLDWDEDCPICDVLNPLYEDYTESNGQKVFKHKPQIDLLKRKKEFITNIYMMNDPNKPENNGKVFLYKMNGTIVKKYNDAISPKSELIAAKIVYDFIEGANFQFIMIAPAKKDDYNDYDSCQFEGVTPICNDEAKMEEIFNGIYALDEFLDEKNFKSYSDINNKFRNVFYGEALKKGAPDASSSSTKVDDPSQKNESNDEKIDNVDEKVNYDKAPTDAVPPIDDDDEEDGFDFDTDE